MEYFERGTLTGGLNAYNGRVLDALEAFRSIVDAASALHDKEIVHRDIKPDNIFVAPDRLVLGDCGLAFEIGSDGRLTTTLENVGSRHFQPPWSEGMRLEDVRPTFDLFSLAKVLWVMVSNIPSLPYWYFDRPKYDLREMFPNDLSVHYIREILKRCVVENEEDMRIHNAGALFQCADTTVKAIRGGCQIPNKPGQTCRYCGIGEYHEIKSYTLYGNLNAPSRLKHYRCKFCGHVDSFAFLRNRDADRVMLPPAWSDDD